VSITALFWLYFGLGMGLCRHVQDEMQVSGPPRLNEAGMDLAEGQGRCIATADKQAHCWAGQRAIRYVYMRLGRAPAPTWQPTRLPNPIFVPCLAGGGSKDSIGDWEKFRLERVAG
jgi:hypothetical protein